MDNTEKGLIGEKFVNEIAFTSFLKYWCYPSPRDHRNNNNEICDLLILFKTACVIISVKNYKFDQNYERYFRSTTERAIRQINGAEKALFREDLEPVTLVHPGREPEVFDKQKIKRVYRIIVNLNTAVKVYHTSLYENDKQYVVMDAEAWQNALSVLDTLPDFLNYINSRLLLTRKHPAIILPRAEKDFSHIDADFLAKLFLNIPKESGATVISGTELDLIATYINHGYSFPEALYNEPTFNALTMKLDGEWEKFSKSDRFKKLKDTLSRSYFIDELVKETIIHTPNGDKLSRMLFSMNRMHRSIFANHFDQFCSMNEFNPFGYRVKYYAKLNPKFVFMLFKDDSSKERFQDLMSLHLVHMNYLYDNSLAEVGLIGRVANSSLYAFGYTDNAFKPSVQETQEMENTLRQLNLKLRSDLQRGELETDDLSDSPIFSSPF